MKFAHVSDTHLGYRQYGSRIREEDYRNALSHVMDRCLEIGVQAVVWGGDIFDTPTPSATVVKFVQEQVFRLREKGIVSVGVDGNHDMTEGKWLGICGIDTFRGEDLVIGSVSFAGVNYERPGPYMQKLKTLADTLRAAESKANVLVIHQPLGDLTAFGCEITASWITKTFHDLDLRYVAMGDIHNYGTWFQDGVYFVYPGSTEMTDIDEDEGKFFVVVDIDDSTGKVTLINESTNPRPIVRYEIHTEADLEVALDDIKGAFGGHVLPSIKLNTDIPNAVLRLRKEIGADVPYRLERFSEETGRSEHLLDRNWTRVGLVNLADFVEKSYAKGTDEYQLIVQMLDDPERAVTIAEEYVLSKELGEICKL